MLDLPHALSCYMDLFVFSSIELNQKTTLMWVCVIIVYLKQNLTYRDNKADQDFYPRSLKSQWMGFIG